MGVVALLSAKGSPGTTTTALLCAALWPTAVLLVDADTEGGDVALRMGRADGAPVDQARGLLSLLPLARREMAPATVPEHAQVLRGGVEVVAGLSGPGQAGAASHLWSNLADALAATRDRDVVVDCGRVSAQSVHLPLLQRADVVVCVLRPDVSGVVHARSRLAALQASLVGPDGHRPKVGLVLVAERPRGRDAEGAAGVLTRDLPGHEVLGRLAHDPVGAGVFEGFDVPRPERTLLVRSGRELVDQLVQSVRHERSGEAAAARTDQPARPVAQPGEPTEQPAEPAEPSAAPRRAARRRGIGGRRARSAS